ncbi:RNase H domain-containing protein, partial [Durusdinium trenchii]
YAIEFLWLALNSAGDSLPSWHKGSLSVPDVEMKTGVAGRLPLSLLATPKAHAVSKIMTLRVCTFNVNTLDPKRGDIVPGFLREQAQWHGFDILFLQETRTRQSNMIQSQTHVRITAAAQQGVGGVEIWLLRRHVNNSRLIFDAKAIQVVIAEPQLLILK